MWMIGCISTTLCIGYGIPQFIFFFDLFVFMKRIEAEGLKKYNEARVLQKQMTIFKVINICISAGLLLTVITLIIITYKQENKGETSWYLGFIYLLTLVLLLVAFMVSISLLHNKMQKVFVGHDFKKEKNKTRVMFVTSIVSYIAQIVFNGFVWFGSKSVRDILYGPSTPALMILSTYIIIS